MFIGEKCGVDVTVEGNVEGWRGLEVVEGADGIKEHHLSAETLQPAQKHPCQIQHQQVYRIQAAFNTDTIPEWAGLSNS